MWYCIASDAESELVAVIAFLVMGMARTSGAWQVTILLQAPVKAAGRH